MKKDLTLTLFARRSRHFAGTRYNRRGLKEGIDGYVANEVESEFIVFNSHNWDFNVHDESKVASVVFMRGSIPVFWGQANPFSPKPEIISNLN